MSDIVMTFQVAPLESDEAECMMIPTLETTRLILRPLNAGDWSAVNAILTDPETTRYMHFGQWTVAQRRSWFDTSVDAAGKPIVDSIQWIIATKETREAIGWFGIGASSNPEADGDTSFGYLLARPYWNHGYMTEALRAVFAFEFDTLGASRLRATCDVENPASARVMEKAGMTRIKTDYGQGFEGNWAHRHHYAITRAEYGSLRVS
jgi:ribosomal-protein-alanine N-acetyltransferase